jgi:uncharacterized protein
VLVGDQMQLAQPLKGTHPEGAGISALGYLLEGRATIPPDLGVFLPTSYRLHPRVCRFISDTVYEGRLRPHPDNARQAVEPRAGGRWITREAGIVFLPVEHEGNTQASEEEAEQVATVVGELLGGRVRDRAGVWRPLGARDVIVVAPYNAQVQALRRVLPADVRVGTVDRFQGQEAAVSIVSLAASTLEDAPRGAAFLFDRNRLNVAVSRAMCLAVVVGSPALIGARCGSLADMERANLFCRLVEYARDTAEAASAHATPSGT